MGTFRLAESFVSINGEGQKAGELALFLRFTGCNLRCSYCDTMWANEKDAPYTLKSTEELFEIAQQSGVRNITLTGGEPLLQPDIAELIDALLQADFRVEIETNGAVSLEPVLVKLTALQRKNGLIPMGEIAFDPVIRLQCRPSFTMDYKLPSSGMESKMCLENFAFLKESDTLKFVCGSQEDLVRAKEIIDEYHPVCKIYLSPVFGQIDPKDMVEFMKQNRMNQVRLQLQLHKFIWDPNEKGV